MRRNLNRFLVIALVASAAGIMLASGASAAFTGLGTASEFAILALPGGTASINEATSIIGDVGYASGVTSTTNQKVATFLSTVYVDSSATFAYTDKNFAPSGGIIQGGVADSLLDSASADAIAASSAIGALAPTFSLGILGDGDNRTVIGNGGTNVISLTSLNYNDDILTLSGGANDIFLFNVSGNFTFSGSKINLVGVDPSQVIFNFTNASSVLINKDTSEFYGTILAPIGSVEYHNPATFEGGIMAKNITLHSAFNLEQAPPVPEPSGLLALLTGLGGVVGYIRRMRHS